MDHRTRAKAVIAEVCGVDAASLTPETQLVADLGIDSARALHLLVKLEDELEIEVDDDQVGELHTVGDIFRFIDGYAPDAAGDERADA